MIGKVYKITSCKGDEIYVGSTFSSLKKRFWEHKTDKCNSKILFTKYGYDSCRIELIKEYEVYDEYQLKAYEQLWMSKYRNQVVNEHGSFCIEKLRKKQHYEDHKEYYKQYYEDHKEERLEKRKQYYEENKDKILEQQKQKYTCSCGSTLTINGKARHERLKKHQEWLESKIMKETKNRYTCNCGSALTKQNKARHERSQKHQDWVKDNQ